MDKIRGIWKNGKYAKIFTDFCLNPIFMFAIMGFCGILLNREYSNIVYQDKCFEHSKGVNHNNG